MWGRQLSDLRMLSAGTNYSTLSNLTCAGAGNDAATNGCLKLHHAYGNILPLSAVLAGGGTACGKPTILKVFGHGGGVQMLADWGLLEASQMDNSTTPATAGECQTLCSQSSGCKFFTFNDGGLSGGGYGYFRGLCFLLDAIACDTPYAEHAGAVSGPATCPSESTPTPTPTPTPSPPKSNATSTSTDGAVHAFSAASAALTGIMVLGVQS